MKNKEKEVEPDDKGDSHNLPVSQHDSIPVIYNLNFSENMRDTEQTSLDPSFFALDDAAYSPRRPTSTITRTPSGDRAPDSFAPIDISGNNSPGLSARTSYDFVSKDQPPSYLFSRNSESLLDIVSRFPDPGRIIPQKRYRPNIQSDRCRYVGEITLYPPIVFYAARSDTMCGISCSDALKTRFPPRRWPTPGNFELSGPPESVHIMWPGYAPWSGKILVRDFGAQPITRAKLAKNVANIIKNFIKAREKTPMDEDADPQYKVGTNHIRIEDLDLLGLEHVAPGSWQAHVRLRHRTEGPLHPVHSEARLRSESIEAMHKQTPLEDGGNTKTDTKLPRDSSLLQPLKSDHPDSSIDGMQSVSDVHPPSW
ncbi:hypothetical protein BC629DRAFT_916671 [Irpex lacteus]|nr:hypothetical protein BC629DRAFT_916671 [Irpex lacteus]